MLSDSYVSGSSSIDIVGMMYRELMEQSTFVTGLSGLYGSWNKRDRDDYARKEKVYNECIRSLARRCCIMWFEGQYYMFNGMIYEPVRQDQLNMAFQRFLESVFIPEMFITRGGMGSYKLNFLKTLEYENVLHPRFDIVAFRNGVLDMRTFSFTGFDKAYHVIDVKPFDYDPNAKCDLWQAFLREVLPDRASRAILQMFLGLGLVERSTVFSDFANREQAKVEVCLLLIGKGSNGKSVIFQTVMGVFGRNKVSSADYDAVTGNGDEGMRNRRLMRDKVFNWSTENESTSFGKRDGVFKKMISGEPTLDRKIGGDVTENFNIPYFVFSLNETPKMATYALLRRLQVIAFDVIIPEEKQNKSLAYELSKEYSGIFNWMARGALEIKRRKFRFPQSIGGMRQKMLMKLRQNPVVAWVEAYGLSPVGRGHGELISAQELYDSLDAFCTDNGVECPTKKKFGMTMGHSAKECLDFGSLRKMDGMYYQVFGCTRERLKEHLQVEHADFSHYASFRNEQGSYLSEFD